MRDRGMVRMFIWFRRLRLRLQHRRLGDYPGGPAPLPNARAVARRRHFCGVGREPFCHKLTPACQPLRCVAVLRLHVCVKDSVRRGCWLYRPAFSDLVIN